MQSVVVSAEVTAQQEEAEAMEPEPLVMQGAEPPPLVKPAWKPSDRSRTRNLLGQLLVGTLKKAQEEIATKTEAVRFCSNFFSWFLLPHDRTF
mgnify:CR=1 FL=1